MRLHGYCTKCHRIRRVRVTNHGMLGRSIPQGVCHECEDKGR